MMKIREIGDTILNTLRRLRAAVIAVCLLNTVISMLPAYYMGRLMDSLNLPVSEILGLGILVVILLPVEFLANTWQNYLWFKLVYRGTALMRSAIFEQVSRNPFSFFRVQNSGDIVNRITNDASMYAQKRLIELPMLIVNVSTLAVAFAFIFSINIPIALVLLLICIGYFFTYRSINVKLRETSVKEREGYSELLHVTTSFYEGLPSIKLFLKEKFFTAKYREVSDRLGERNIELQKWKSVSLCLSSAIVRSLPIATVILGVFLTLRGACTIGSIFTIYSFTSLLGEPIRNLTDFNITLQQGKVTENRLEEIFCEEEETPDQVQLQGMDRLAFDHVDFSYDLEHYVLRQFDLQLQKGDRIGIVGSSGAGKTTLIRLLTGQLSPVGGEISVNGMDLRTVGKASYLGRIAIMPQDIFLYDDTVTNNILFGREVDQARFEQVVSALEISSFMDRKISELSGGERKRIGLARTILGEFDLLILDEPTSDVDPTMEKKIISFIDSYLTTQDKMMVVITHRPAILDICTEVKKIG